MELGHVVGTHFLTFCRSEAGRFRRHVGELHVWRQLRRGEVPDVSGGRWSRGRCKTSMTTFAAVKQDGSVVTWGFALLGGNSDSVKSELQRRR